MKTILWLREDLRLHDNLALNFAAESGEFIAVYIYPEGLGAASYWWLHHSLKSLRQQFESKGISLILRTGEPHQALSKLCSEINADQVVWNRVYSPLGIEQGQQVKQAIEDSELKSKSFN